MKKRIEAGNQIVFCAIDLDNFKAYNDRYGYARGNYILKSTAQIIEDSISIYDSEKNFVGHIGGDDFIIITSTKLYSKICKYIINAFDKTVVEFYDPEDVSKGYICGKTRDGKVRNFPIMSISITVVTNQNNKNMNYVKFCEKTAELKEYAKSFPKSLLVKERRKEKNK